MKGEDFPEGFTGSTGDTGAKGQVGTPVEFKGIRRGRLTIKVDPGEKLLWRKAADGTWARHSVDASVQS